MINKLGVICYVPPKRVYPAVDSFIQNIRDNPTKNELILYSDEEYGKDVIRLAGPVESAKYEGNKMAVNNAIFWTGVRIAASKGMSHIMVLENDCRVSCPGWDEIVFKEFFTKNPNAVCGGSFAVFNPCSVSGTASRRWERFLIDTAADRPMPLSVTGSANLAETRPSCVFPNGAFAIYRMDYLLKAFPVLTTNDVPAFYEFVQKTKTWDYLIGDKLWEDYGEKIYDNIVSIGCIYSGYGNVMSSEEERRNLLTSGRVIGVHQIKSDWRPEKNGVNPTPAPLKKVDRNTSIFIVTYRRDFEYLKYCLRSVEKFASGFSDVTILVPTPDVGSLKEVIKNNYNGKIPIRIKYGYEWAGKGFLWHMAQICRADEWALKSTDYIAHIDPDCVFTEPVTPETFCVDGKPVLRYEPFATLCKREPGIWRWKIACDNALPFEVNDEFMRGHPELYHRSVYEKTRQLVEEKTKMPFNEYVRSCKNEFPQTFAEFPTIGAVAAKCFTDSYHLHDCSRDQNPDKSPWPVFQAWSHKPPTDECELMYQGSKQKIIPLNIYKQLKLD